MKISIITICFNSAQYLEQTIRSVTDQTYTDREYIVIDGGSTDGTVDIIRKYEDKIDKWISEPDNGIADAMNKGLSFVSGDYVIFLHSDDYFIGRNAISSIIPYLSKQYDIYLFNIYLSNKGKKKLYRPRGFNWWMNFKTGVFHQAAVCSKNLFLNIGMFDTTFAIGMDYDLFLRAFRAGVKAKKIDKSFSVMRLCGISSQKNWSNVKNRMREERLIHLKNCSKSWMRLIYRTFWAIYMPYKKIRSTFEIA